MEIKKLLEEFLLSHEQYVPSYIFFDRSNVKSDAEICKERFGLEYDEKSKHVNAFFSHSWIVGGQEGGSCWDVGESHHYPVDTEPEIQDWDLEDFIEEKLPHLTHMNYKKLANKIRFHEYSHSEYYGNYTNHKIKYITFADIESVLVGDD